MLPLKGRVNYGLTSENDPSNEYFGIVYDMKGEKKPDFAQVWFCEHSKPVLILIDFMRCLENFTFRHCIRSIIGESQEKTVDPSNVRRQITKIRNIIRYGLDKYNGYLRDLIFIMVMKHSLTFIYLPNSWRRLTSKRSENLLSENPIEVLYTSPSINSYTEKLNASPNQKNSYRYQNYFNHPLFSMKVL